jgi:hypothetical protein
MTSFLFDLVSSVFRPAFAALAIAAALAVVSVDNNTLTVSNSVVDVTNFGCSGLLKPICQLSLF